MKRSIAAFGATIIGLTGVVVSTAPAQAAAPGCATTTDQQVSAGDAAAQDFYMDCTPLYGVGKADLTITSETEFSSDFTLGDDSQATVTSSIDDAAAGVYEDTTVRGGFTNLSSPDTSDDSLSQSYSNSNSNTSVAFPIASVAKVDVSALPAVCTPDAETYAGAYEITYKPVTTRFYPTSASGQSISGQPGMFVLTSTPAPLFLGLNFASGGNDFDANAPQCAISATSFNQGDTNQSGGWYFATQQALSLAPTTFSFSSNSNTSNSISTTFGTAALELAQVQPVITTTTLPAATVGTAYSTTIAATGGKLSYSLSGTLPAGLKFDAATAVISGTPTGAGHSAFTITASNTVGSVSRDYTIDPAAAASGSATTITLVPTSSSYGKGASVAIAVRSGSHPVSAMLSAKVDGVPTSVPALVSGVSKLSLSKRLGLGKHTIEIGYAGDATTAAQTAVTTVTISKAVTVTVVKLAHTKSSSKLKATITVKVPGTALTATGKAKISVNGKTAKIVTLSTGKATVTFSTKTRAKGHKVAVTYLGSALFAADRSVTHAIIK